MKIKFLITCFFGLAATAAFAQKGELKNAQSSFETYDGLRGQKSAAIAAKAKSSLMDAKTSIDKASADAKTGAMPQTYAYKAVIYSSLAMEDTVSTTSAPLFATADEALKKAKEADTKAEFKKITDEAGLNLAQYQLNNGIKDYQNKKYPEAYKEFDYYRTVLPEDTNAIYYTGLAAVNAAQNDPKYYPLAISNYQKLVTTKYSQGARIYLDMSSIYLAQKDTASAMKIAGEGITKYPTSQDLRRREIEIGLQSGKQAEIVGKIQAAIANDPKNKDLQYYLGLTYSQIGDAANKASEKATGAAKTTQHNAALDNYAKAADAYKKALEIDPNYFEANMNLGYVLMRPALDVYNDAQKLPSSQQKQYEAEMKKSDTMLDAAKPYLTKAVELQPKSEDALKNLWSYYRAKSNPAQAAENKAKANEIKKQIDALK